MKEPWKPCNWEPADASAVQALMRGEATPDQQQRVFKWIVEEVSMTYQPTYFPNERDTSFAEGRRYVGLMIIEKSKLNIPEIVRRKNVNTSGKD